MRRRESTWCRTSLASPSARRSRARHTGAITCSRRCSLRLPCRPLPRRVATSFWRRGRTPRCSAWRARSSAGSPLHGSHPCARARRIGRRCSKAWPASMRAASISIGWLSIRRAPAHASHSRAILSIASAIGSTRPRPVRRPTCLRAPFCIRCWDGKWRNRSRPPGCSRRSWI